VKIILKNAADSSAFRSGIPQSLRCSFRDACFAMGPWSVMFALPVPGSQQTPNHPYTLLVDVVRLSTSVILPHGTSTSLLQIERRNHVKIPSAPKGTHLVVADENGEAQRHAEQIACHVFCHHSVR
jgi:hypothetical protein